MFCWGDSLCIIPLMLGGPLLFLYNTGADFDILIVGIFVHDLIKAEGWEGYSVVTAFPDYLEEQSAG